MKYKFVVLLLFTLFSLTSCYTTSYTYVGNSFQKCIGQNKNEIVRTIGAPDRIQDDGAGGSILIYEQQMLTTFSTANSASYGRSTTVGAAVYGNGGIIGASDTRAGQVSSMNGLSQSIISKTYVNLFINPQNVVYDFKSNYGALYNSSRCYDKKATNKLLLWTGIYFFPSLLFSIPIANHKRHLAEKNGELCK